MKKITLLLALFIVSISFGQITINEVDADQTSTDTEEFIELLSDTPNFSLDGYIVVLYNGSSDVSYTTVDLTGFTTDVNGYFIIGSDAVTGVDIALGPDNTIQNGADAIAIYQDAAGNFPDGTAVTSTNLIDAIVYGTSDGDDAELLAGLGETVQYDENLNGMKDTESIQARGDGTYCVALPTLRAANACPTCTFVITTVNTTCDNETGGTDTVTVEVSYTGGGTETFNVSADAGTVGGDDPTSVANGTIVITGVDENSTVTLTVTSTNCNTSEAIDTPICEAATNVSNIGALRGSAEGSEYVITGEVLLTYQEDFRNQKYIEDATGAILIDDNAGVITSMYNIGDGLTGMTGTLTSFGGMMEFVPTQDPGAASSTGNTITAQTVSITALNANPNNYEAEFVKIESVMIDNSIESTWVTGTVYAMTNADGTFNFRTSFFNADYIGSDVPTQTANVKGIITERNNGDFFITARSSSDISTNLSVGQNSLDAFTIYPNPTTKGYINITSQVSGAKKVVVYNVLGKQVISTNLTGERLDVSGLNSGVYIVKISQGDASVTKKLVIR